MKKPLHAGSMLIALLFLSQHISAQIAIGAKLGLNLATWRNTTEEFLATDFKLKHVAGMNIGLACQIELSEMLSLQQELMYIQKGYSVDYSSVEPNLVQILKFNYLELPVLMKLSFPFNESLAVFANAGPSVGYALNAKSIYIYDGDKETDKIDLGDPDGLKRTDFSMAFGGGVDLKAASVRLLLEARYLYGFSNLFEKNSEGFVVYNRGVGIAAGVMVDL
jgi:Outer membrane protein beta-barrel domain